MMNGPTALSRDPIFVLLFLRGGCDGLNMVAPTADANYLSERRAETRIERTGDHPGLVLPNTFADSDFRIHFKAEKLKQLYDQKHLAIVHAAGLTNGTRSHFEAMDYIERGTPDNKNTSTGWLTRLIADQDIRGLVPIITTSNNVPASLLACQKAIAVPNVRRMQLGGDGHFKAAQEALLRQQYQGSSGVNENGKHVLDVIDIFAKRIPHDATGKQVDYTPKAGVVYPTEGYTGELSNAFKTLAQVIKMDVGVQIATVDFGGWDTHVDQQGRFINLTDTLSRSLGAFWDDMANYQERLVVVVMSEFGRRLKSNESRGTDHGHGNMMMVLGGAVKGGNIYGRWPGLANEHLDNQVDLAVTTDYRSVLSEVMFACYPQMRLSKVFPNYARNVPLGLIA